MRGIGLNDITGNGYIQYVGSSTPEIYLWYRTNNLVGEKVGYSVIIPLEGRLTKKFTV